eukprot:3098165-Rhodomonas_salina.1
MEVVQDAIAVDVLEEGEEAAAELAARAPGGGGVAEVGDAERVSERLREKPTPSVLWGFRVAEKVSRTSKPRNQ